MQSILVIGTQIHIDAAKAVMPTPTFWLIIRLTINSTKEDMKPKGAMT